MKNAEGKLEKEKEENILKRIFFCREGKGVKSLEKENIFPEDILQRLKVSRSQGLKVSRSQGLKVSRGQGLKVSGSQGLKVSRSQGLKVSWSHGLKVLKCQGI